MFSSGLVWFFSNVCKWQRERQTSSVIIWSLPFCLLEVMSRWLNKECPTWSCSPNCNIVCLQFARYLQSLCLPLITIFWKWDREFCAAGLDQELWFDFHEFAFSPASPMLCSACIAFLAGDKPWSILCPKPTLAKCITSAAPLNKINLNILCFQLKFSGWKVSLVAR